MTEGWKKVLLFNKVGEPRAQLSNAMLALRRAPEWFGVLEYDLFAMQTVMAAPPPWEASKPAWINRPWTEYDDLLATNWLQQQGVGVPLSIVQQAVEAVARDASYHPVIDYLEGVEHDGIPRLGTWLSDYLGAASNSYHSEVGKVMLIGAVARIFRPGCKNDLVPILEGKQGAKKSTAMRTMFAPWFSDELAELGSKDAAMQTRIWGLELSELDAMSRAEVSRVKAFISRSTDRFRPPYGRRLVESPRTCVLWGTTNGDGYLKDETGGRRYLPVKVGRIDIERLEADRDQLWAEAVKAFKGRRDVVDHRHSDAGRRRKGTARPLCRRSMGCPHHQVHQWPHLGDRRGNPAGCLTHRDGTIDADRSEPRRPSPKVDGMGA